MDIINYIQSFIPETDSPEKVYSLFHGLRYPKDKILNPTYKRKIDEFEFAKEERKNANYLFIFALVIAIILVLHFVFMRGYLKK